MRADQLSPAIVEIIINGEAYELSPFSLRAMVDLAAMFSESGDMDEGVLKMYSYIEDSERSKDTVFAILFYLLVDKDAFAGSICQFKKTLKSCKEAGSMGFESYFEYLVSQIVRNIENAQPISDKGPGEENKIDAKDKRGFLLVLWEEFYTTFAMAIPQTIDQFYTQTIRQIYGVLEVINKKKHEELVMKVDLAGREFKAGPATKSRFSSETDKTFKDAAKADIKNWQNPLN